MPKLTSNPGSLPEGALQFENTDFSEARRALDEPPAGLDVARKLRPPNRESRRRASLPTDHAIGTCGRLDSFLPPNVRPLNLADSTPRIANALPSIGMTRTQQPVCWRICWWIDGADAVGFLLRSRRNCCPFTSCSIWVDVVNFHHLDCGTLARTSIAKRSIVVERWPRTVRVQFFARREGWFPTSTCVTSPDAGQCQNLFLIRRRFPSPR